MPSIVNFSFVSLSNISSVRNDKLHCYCFCCISPCMVRTSMFTRYLIIRWYTLSYYLQTWTKQVFSFMFSLFLQYNVDVLGVVVAPASLTLVAGFVGMI